MLRKLGTLAFAVSLVVASAWALWAQSGGGTTHVVLTNDQDFLVSNDKYLSGVYECSDGGYIDFSCLTGHLPEVNCPDGFAIQTIGTGLAPVGCIEVGGGGGEPAGADTYIQYNNMDVFGADQNFTWDYTNSILTLGGAGPGTATFSGEVLANLPAGASDGTIAYCTDCTIDTSPCTDSGTGSMAERINGEWVCFGAAGAASGYDTIEDDGTPLTQRSTVNFIGAGVSCADNGGTSETDCTISGSSGNPDVYTWIGAAGCNATTAYPVFNLPALLPAVETCSAGTNTLDAYLAYADGSDTLQAQKTIALAPDWDSGGSTDVVIWWNTSATSGNVVWQVATACVAVGEVNDPAFNTASTVTDAAQGTTLWMNTATITGLTMTGCAADEYLHLKVFRDPTNGSDTLAADANLFGIRITFPKT